MSGEASSSDNLAPAAFNTNEMWLLSSVFKHANNGIRAADVNWDALLLEAGCPYTTKSSATVTFNKLRRKIEGLRSGDAAAATPGTPASSAADTPKSVAKTLKTPRKKKEETAVGGTPQAKVTKPRGKRASTIKKEVLEKAVKMEEEDDGDISSDPSNPAGQLGGAGDDSFVGDSSLASGSATGVLSSQPNDSEPN